MTRPKLIEVKGTWLTGKVIIDGEPFPYPIRHLGFDMGPGEWPKLILEIDADRVVIDQDMFEKPPLLEKPAKTVKTLVFALNQRDAKVAAQNVGILWRDCIYVSHATVLRGGTPGAPRIQASSYPERRDYLEIEEHLRILDATVAAPPEPTVVAV